MRSLRIKLAALAALSVVAAISIVKPVFTREPLPELDAMVGQMLLVGFNGTAPDSPGARRVTEQVASGEIGGVILMDRNIRSPKQVRALTSKFRGTGHPLVPFISVDQEGGLVQRLSARKGFKAYPMARTVAKRYTPDRAYSLYRGMAEELAGLGINFNFGPVVDLSINRSNRVIVRRGRSFGDDPDDVLAYARAFILAHRDANILTSVKHFPGHGSSRTDSHKRLVDLSRTWEPEEFEPYRALAREGAIDTLMVGHLYHPAISGEQRLPATLASTAIEGWIRGELEYQGVVITDDLGMGAIRKHYDLRDTLIKAVLSGNDILLFSNVGKDAGFVPKATRILREAVNDGTIPKKRIEQAYLRIKTLKEHLRERALWQSGVEIGPT